MTPEDWAKFIGSSLGGLVTGAGGLTLARRIWSRDAVAIAKEKAETTLVLQVAAEQAKGRELLQAERTMGMERARDRAILYEEVLQANAGLKALTTHQKERIEALIQHHADEMARRDLELISFKRRVVRMFPETEAMINSNFVPFPDEPQEPKDPTIGGRR